MARKSRRPQKSSRKQTARGSACPFQAGARGFNSFPEPMRADKARGTPEKFGDHYTEAALFHDRQSPIEQAQAVRAFRFELSRVPTPAVRERIVSQLVNVDAALAKVVSQGIGIKVPHAQPAVMPRNRKPEVARSPALSLFARPGDGSIRARRIAIVVADGVDDAVTTLHELLIAKGAVPRYLGVRLGSVTTAAGATLNIEATFQNMPSALFDALALAGGPNAELAKQGAVLEFIRDQYRHCKPLLALGAGAKLCEGGLDGGRIRNVLRA